MMRIVAWLGGQKEKKEQQEQEQQQQQLSQQHQELEKLKGSMMSTDRNDDET